MPRTVNRTTRKSMGEHCEEMARRDTSMEKLARLPPVFERTSGKGTLTAGNSSPLTDGAAGIWVGTGGRPARLQITPARAKLIDFEMAAVDIQRARAS